MTRTYGIIIGTAIAASLVLSAIIIRNGLMAIATQVRDKPILKWPDELHVTAGGSKLNLEVKKMTMQQGSDMGETKISIDNVRVTTPATQQSR